MGEQARRSALFIVAVLVSLGMALRGEADVCPLPGGGAIAGRVTAAATGDPLVDAALVAERFVDGTLIPVAATTTGPTGHYQFAALVPGSYFVRTQSTALLVDEVWPDIACDQVCNPQDSGTPVAVAAGDLVGGIDFALDTGGRLEGTVFLADGVTPVPGARVEGFALGPFGTFGLVDVVADAGGAWSFDGLESRDYKVRASAPGLVAEVYPNAVCSMSCDVFNAGSPIAVTAGATTAGIDVALAAGTPVSGSVTDLAAVPLAGVAVSVHSSAGGGSVFAQTDANGAWHTLEGLLPGTYFARTSSGYLDELWNNLPCEPFCTVTAGTPIVVGASPVTGIDFALGRLGAISGTIVESGTGQPLANVMVVARSNSAPFPAIASTASDGTYRIGGLAPESYVVAAVDGEHVGEIYADAGTCYDPFTCAPSSSPTFVDVVGAGEVAGIDFALDPGGVLSGVVVVAATNAPANGASVSIFRLDGGYETGALANTSGQFRVSGLPSGTSYRVVALPPGGSGLLGEVWEEQPCTPGTCVPDAGTPVPVALNATACVAFSLDGIPEGAGISGQVTGANGGALAGVQIAIYDATGALAGTVLSDASGAYLTNGALDLPAATYYALATGPFGYANELFDGLPCVACDPTSGTPVVVTAGATTGGIDFDLELVGAPPLPLIYLEDCKPTGCVYFRGFEDSRVNRSSILAQNSANLPPFALPPSFWNDLVACVQRAYRPFGVTVTDIDPGSLPHLEHVIAGIPQNIGQDATTAGVSPYTCGFIPNSTSFTFSGIYSDPSPTTLAELCWTAVHEIGHQHGLDHHAYVPDAMTYAPGCGAKLLPARNVACGEFIPEPCVCGGASENSYAQVRAVYGASDLLFGDGFEVVEPGENCAWSLQNPPPVPFAPPALAPAHVAPRCGALESSNPGFQPQPRGTPRQF